MLSSLIQSHAEHYSHFEKFLDSISSRMTKHSTNRKQSLYTCEAGAANRSTATLRESS